MKRAFILRNAPARRWLSVAAVAATICIFGGSQPRLARPARGQEGPPEANAPRQLGFAYDPQREEGPHPESDFEWWYHFGFLKPKGSTDFAYSFVSSFQRSPKGRYLFYNLADLKTGGKRHVALVDRSLFGVSERPGSLRSDEADPAAESAGENIGRRLLRWSLEFLPVLPEGHAFMPPQEPSDAPPQSALWLRYGPNRFEKQESTYRAFYRNDRFVLDLTLRPEGPPLPVLGTGLTGLDKPEDQHYYTYPRMSATGRLRKGGSDSAVDGDFWYDHQWGRIASRDLMKWCWWGLRLEDGRSLSIFFLQNKRTGKTVQKGLTLHHPNGRTEVDRDVSFVAKRSWKSPREMTYSVEWEITATKPELAISIRPRTDDHEIPVLLYGQIWEGPCTVEVRGKEGRAVLGIGFQELIGQAHE